MARPPPAEHRGSAAETGAFGCLLREYRLAAGLSQEVLAERAHLSVDAIGALERGVRHVPQRQTLALLVAALGLEGAARAQLEAAAAPESRPRRRATGGDAGAPTSRHNLSSGLTSFVGRAREIATVAELMRQERLVTVTGPGGVGKTRFAQRVGLEIADRYADGARLVDLAPLPASVSVARELASALGIDHRSQRPAKEVLVAALATKDLLVILDDCEHVVEAAAETIAFVLERCPNVRVLATSREALRIDGERVYPMPSLSVPPAGAFSPEEAVRYEAIQLFVERAPAADPEFQLTVNNVGAVADIARHLDGIPFAIELAATKLAVLTPSQIARRLGERFRLFGEGRRNALPRHQTLRALIDWSYTLLSETERSMLRRLAIFPASWTLDAAASVCSGNGIALETVLDLVSSLTAKSLVMKDVRDGDEPRFRLLETTRAYAFEHLREEGLLDALARGHAEYVLAFARDAAARFASTREREWLDGVAQELDNLRTALQWSLGEGNAIPIGAEIVASLGFFWHSRRHHEGVRWLSAALAVIDRLDLPLRAHVLMESVRTFSSRVVELAEDAVSAYRAIGDTAGLRRSLQYLGHSLINTRRYAEARTPLEESIKLAIASGDDATQARSMVALGFVSLYAGDRVEASSLFRSAAEIATRTRRDRDVAVAFHGLADVALSEGNSEEAVRLARSSLETFESLGDLRATGWQRSHVATALLAAGSVDEATAQALEGLRILEDSDIPLAHVEALIVAAATLARQGAVAHAAACARRAVELQATHALRINPLLEALLRDVLEAVSVSGPRGEDEFLIRDLLRKEKH